MLLYLFEKRKKDHRQQGKDIAKGEAGEKKKVNSRRIVLNQKGGGDMDRQAIKRLVSSTKILIGKKL